MIPLLPEVVLDLVECNPREGATEPFRTSVAL
jgi:hypothetical protein